MTKTIHGVVKHSPGHKQAKFETPAGTITINIPDDILPGETFSGSVISEPFGKNKKDIEKNGSILRSYRLQFSNNLIHPDVQPSYSFSISTQPATQPMDWSLDLIDQKGKPASTISWKQSPAGGITQSISNPNGIINMNAYSSGDQILWSNLSRPFQSTDQFSLTGQDNKAVKVEPLTLSSRQTVIQIPPNLTTGYYMLSRTAADGSISEQKDVVIFDLELSSPNTNLSGGQRSNIQARIVLPEQGWTDHPLPYSFRIDLQNVSPNTISMHGGDMQRVILPTNHNWRNRDSWKVQRTITGVKPGSFSVNATLHNDLNISNDAFQPQLDVLNTAADLNRWGDVLKQDLANYSRMQPNDAGGNAIRTNATRAINNMPNCTTSSDIEACKQFIQMLLRPMNIPKSAASIWLSGLEAYKTAATNMTPEMFDAGILRNGLGIIEKLAANDPLIKSNAVIALRNLENMERYEPAKERIQDIKNELLLLNSLIDSRLGKDLYKNYGYSLKDLNSSAKPVIFPDKSINIKNSIIGFLDPVKKVLMASPEYMNNILKSLNGAEQSDGSYRIQSTSLSGNLVSYIIRILPVPQTAVYDEHEYRVKYLTEDKKKNPDTPPIIGLSKDSTGTWYRFFKDAQCPVDGEAYDGECSEESDLINHPDGSHEWKKNGIFSKVHFQAINQCKRGENYCTEALQVWRIKYIYDDAKCAVLRQVVTEYEFGCK